MVAEGAADATIRDMEEGAGAGGTTRMAADIAAVAAEARRRVAGAAVLAPRALGARARETRIAVGATKTHARSSTAFNLESG